MIKNENFCVFFFDICYWISCCFWRWNVKKYIEWIKYFKNDCCWIVIENLIIGEEIGIGFWIELEDRV